MLYNPKAQKESYKTSYICARILEVNSRLKFHVLKDTEENMTYDALMFDAPNGKQVATVDFKNHERLREFAPDKITVPLSSLKHGNDYIIQYTDDYKFITIIDCSKIKVKEGTYTRRQKTESGTYPIKWVKINRDAVSIIDYTPAGDTYINAQIADLERRLL